MQATWRKSDSGKSLKCSRAAERHALIPWKAAPPTSMLFAHALCMTYSDLSPSCLVEVMKRQRSESSISSDCSSDRVVRKSKHREGYNADWKDQYTWLLPVADRDEPTEICGLLCELCQRHKVTQRSGGYPSHVPCFARI